MSSSTKDASASEKSHPGHRIHDTESKKDPEERLGSVLLATEDENEAHEVFQIDADVNFRSVGWVRCAMILLKITFATGVLAIPVAMAGLGAVGGSLSVIGWGALNTYAGVIQGDFRNNHRGCHSIADMAQVVGGRWLKEVIGGLFIIAFLLASGAGITGVSIAFNVFSSHGACTVWFTFVAAVMVAVCASVRRFHEISWLTWVGFISIFSAVFIVVIAVTTRDRPAAAPQTGPYELGYYAVASPKFATGMVSTSTIFVSSAGSSSFLPVISEMREPRDYRKALFVAMGLVTASYLSLSLVIYRWCGVYVASPSLGSAGKTIEVVAYGVGFLGLVVSACLYLHVAAKYCFVRFLRNSRHLQENTVVHWATWLGCTFGLCSISFILAEAIPVFNYLVALTGSVCFAPLAIILPGYLWLYDHKDWRRGSTGQRTAFWLHALMIPLGAFICVGGTYGVVQNIKEAYATGQIGGVFSCANNA